VTSLGAIGGRAQRLEDRRAVGAVQPCTWGPDRGANREDVQIGQSADVIEVEVREHDVKFGNSVEQAGIGKESACAGADVEQQCSVSVADKDTGCLSRA
jgi:hypothetical protein